MPVVGHEDVLQLLAGTFDGGYDDRLERFVSATVSGYVVMLRLTPPEGSSDQIQEYLISAG